MRRALTALVISLAVGATAERSVAQTPQISPAAIRDMGLSQAADLMARIETEDPFVPSESIGTMVLPVANAALAARRAETVAATAGVTAARAERLPVASARASAGWIANPPEAVTFAAGELGTIPLSQLNPLVPDTSLPERDTTLFDGADATRYELGLSLEQPIFTSGKIQRGIAAAGAAHALALARMAADQHAADVRAAGLVETLACLRGVEASLELQSAAADRLVAISREGHSGGFVKETELLDAELARQSVALAHASLRERRHRALWELRRLVGDPNLSEIAVRADIPGANVLPGDLPSRISRVAHGNRDVHILEAVTAVRAAEAEVAGASRVLRPDAGFEAELSWVGSLEDASASAWSDRGDWQITLGLAVSGTLFDCGRSAAAIDRATAIAAQAAQQRADLEAHVTAAVHTTAEQLALTKAQLEHSAATLRVLLRKEEDAMIAFRAGYGSEADLLRAMIESAGTVAEGYLQLAEYRTALWTLVGLEGSALY